jgi:hypothetical protein
MRPAQTALQLALLAGCVTIDTALLVKDIVLLAASFSLFRQDVIHAILSAVPLRQKNPSGERLACNQSAAIPEL